MIEGRKTIVDSGHLFSEQKCGLCLFWEFSGQNGKKTLEEILVLTKGTSESSCAPKGFFVPTLPSEALESLMEQNQFQN